MRKFIGNLICCATPVAGLFAAALAAPAVGLVLALAAGVAAGGAVMAFGLSVCG